MQTEPIRVQVARVLHAVAQGSSLDTALTQHLNGTEQQPFGRALCYSTLRHGWSNAALLARLSTRPPKPLIGALVRAALSELRFLATPEHAVVAESVAAARMFDSAAAGFVNAVLRRFLRERVSLEAALIEDPQARLEHPRWLIEQFSKDWPGELEQLCAMGNRAAPMWLRVDARSGSRDAYIAELAELGISCTAPASPPYALRLAEAVAVERLPGFAQGRVSVQDASAQWVVEALDARPGQRVLDACAAPGGKTAALAERVADLRITALDHQATRMARLHDTLARCRVNARVLLADAADASTWWDGQSFDRILIDAPCTGTGVIRRHPDIKHLRRASDVNQLAVQQARSLDALWPMLARGGRLTYATCSVLTTENQAQIEGFLRRTPSARALPLALPGFLAVGPGYQNLSGVGEQDGFF